MREVQILSWCEACWADGQVKTPAVDSWTVGIVQGENPPALHIVDACEQHGKELTDLLALVKTAELFTRKVIVPVPAAKRRPYNNATPDGFACPVCDQILTTRPSLVGHVWSQHRPDGRPTSPMICPDCSKDFDTAASCAVHRQAAHGYDPLSEVLSGVPGHGSGMALGVSSSSSDVLFKALADTMMDGRRTTPEDMAFVLTTLQKEPGIWHKVGENVKVGARSSSYRGRGLETQGRDMSDGVGELWLRWPAE